MRAANLLLFLILSLGYMMGSDEVMIALFSIFGYIFVLDVFVFVFLFLFFYNRRIPTYLRWRRYAVNTDSRDQYSDR